MAPSVFGGGIKLRCNRASGERLAPAGNCAPKRRDAAFEKAPELQDRSLRAYPVACPSGFCQIASLNALKHPTSATTPSRARHFIPQIRRQWATNLIATAQKALHTNNINYQLNSCCIIAMTYLHHVRKIIAGYSRVAIDLPSVPTKIHITPQ